MSKISLATSSGRRRASRLAYSSLTWSCLLTTVPFCLRLLMLPMHTSPAYLLTRGAHGPYRPWPEDPGCPRAGEVDPTGPCRTGRPRSVSDQPSGERSAGAARVRSVRMGRGVRDHHCRHLGG